MHCSGYCRVVHNQIVMGTHYEKIRDQAILKSWRYEDLRKEGMKIERVARGELGRDHRQGVEYQFRIFSRGFLSGTFFY